MKKTALVTGASSGIGKATARELAKAGYKVYGASRNTNRMADLKSEGIEIIELDVANDDSIVSTVNKIIQLEGSVDVLVNNAGYGQYGSIENVSLSEARYQLEVNLFGAVRLIQLVLPYMRANAFGKVINVTSVGGKLATSFGGWYHASKFGLEGLSDSLRQEVKSFGIDVIVVEPGAIETEWGSIATDNMLKSAAGTVYEDEARKRAEFLKQSSRVASDPKVIADLILEAVTAIKPQTRYFGGAYAAEMLEARKHMSDAEFDALLAGPLN
ncbi:MAG: oxidoreductase [Flavitalea sp.]